MVFGQQPKAHKVELSDYGFQKDVDNRLFLAGLSEFDVEVLKEVVYNSLTFPLQSIAECLNVPVETLHPIMGKLSQMGLCSINNDIVHLNKEMRKYYELHTGKFEEDFRPDVEYIQELLNLVPIPVLPVWYAIPRTSSNIFESIVEKYFQTPKNYERHLDELQFDEEILNEIQKALFEAEDFTLFIEDILDAYDLSHRDLEELILLLEYNFVGMLSYRLTDDGWKEILTPFYEWHQLLRCKRDSKPTPITDVVSIKRFHSDDFGFVQDLTKLTRIACQEQISIATVEAARKYIPDLLAGPQPERYLTCIREIIELLDLCAFDENQVHPSSAAQKWLSTPIQEQALSIYRVNKHGSRCSDQFNDRNLREIEKSLRDVMYTGWIYFDQFVKHITVSVGNAEPIQLVRKGRKWQYALPQYSEHEKEIAENILNRLFQAGMISPGIHEERLCFSVTPFGRITLGS